MKTWLLKRSDLTDEQLRVVEMPTRKHLLISGPAGSGKTQVLAHRAAYLAETGSSPSVRGFLFVLTDVARNFIRSGVKALGLPEDVVTTFNAWCRHFYTTHISKNLPRVYVNGRIDYARTREKVLGLLGDRKNLQGRLAFALVDDGQDLTLDVYKILGFAARHVTVFIDSLQRISDEGVSESLILNTLPAEKREIPFLGNFRSSSSVARLASCFLEDEETRKQYAVSAPASKTLMEHPLCYVAPSPEDEEERLATVIQQRQIMGERVGIIVPKNALVHKLAKGLHLRGIETEKAVIPDAQNVIHQPFDFGNDLPKITTFSMAKGLAFDSVLMPHLTEDSFRGVDQDVRRRMLFVGILRASKWTFMSTVRGNEFKEFSVLQAASKQQFLIIE